MQSAHPIRDGTGDLLSVGTVGIAVGGESQRGGGRPEVRHVGTGTVGRVGELTTCCKGSAGDGVRGVRRERGEGARP